MRVPGEAGDAAAEGVDPLGFKDEECGHRRPVAVADVEAAVDGGAEQKRDGEAENVGGGVAAEVGFVAEFAPELGGPAFHAVRQGRCGGFDRRVLEEVKGGEDQHLEGAAGEDHLGAADGVVQSTRGSSPR